MSESPELSSLVIKGLQQKMAKVFGIRQPHLRFTNDVFATLIAEGSYRTDNPDMKYPITYLRPTTVGANLESYNTKFWAKSPLAKRFGITQTPDGSVPAFNIVPTVLQMEFGYITDDPVAFLSFAHKWAFAAEASSCNFAIKFEGVRFDIRVRLEPSLDIPEKEGGTDAQQQGVAIAPLSVYTYANGEIQRLDPNTLSPTPVLIGGVKLLDPS